MFRPEFAPKKAEECDAKIRRDIEGGPDQKLRDGKIEGEAENQRLTKEEAILYQRYATEIEGINFSEQAEIYDEAEYLISELRKIKGLDLGKYNVEKIDLSNAINRLKLEDGLMDVIQELAKKENMVGFINEVKKIKDDKGNNATILILAMIATALFNGQPNIALAQQNNIPESAISSQSIEKESESKVKVIGDVTPGRIEVIRKYLIENKLNEFIREISIDRVTAETKGGLSGAAEITIIQIDGRKFSESGSHHWPHYDSLEDKAFRKVEELLKKYVNEKIDLGLDSFSHLPTVGVENLAIKEALEAYKRTLEIEKKPKAVPEKWHGDRE